MRNRQRLELFAAPSTIRFAILRSPLTDLVRSVSERSHRLAMAKEDLRFQPQRSMGIAALTLEGCDNLRCIKKPAMRK